MRCDFKMDVIVTMYDESIGIRRRPIFAIIVPDFNARLFPGRGILRENPAFDMYYPVTPKVLHDFFRIHFFATRYQRRARAILLTRHARDGL